MPLLVPSLAGAMVATVQRRDDKGLLGGLRNPSNWCDTMNNTIIGHKGLPTAAIAGIVAAVVATVVATVAVFAQKGEGQTMGTGEPLPVHSGATRSDTVGVRKVSWWPYGTCYDVAYDQSTGLLVIGSGGAILLLDVSDPSRPSKVNELVLEGQHQHIAVSDGIAYVTTYRRNGLQIIDISNPSSPLTIGFYPTEDVPHGIEIVEKIVYLSAGPSLDILDVSNPSSPYLIARYTVGGRAAHTSINQNNNKLYLIVWGEGVYVLDISNSAAPNQLGFYPSPNVAHFAVFGNFAFVGDWHTSILQILDVSNDSAFEVISTLELNEPGNQPGVVLDIEFSGSLAYVSGEYFNHLRIIDISNPYNPVIVGTINAEETTRQLNEAGIPRGQYYVGTHPITLVGNLLFQAAWTCGVGIFDVSQPASIHAIGNFETPDPYSDVSISGHIACIANHSDGLRLLDISDPLDIREIGSQSPGLGAGTSVQVICTDAQYGYVVTEGHGLQIFDIAQPDSPCLVGSLDTPGWARGIALSNGFAYIADSEGGLRVADVRVPDSPVEVGFSLFSASTTRVAVSDEYAYVGTEDGYLQIVDVSDPAKPNVVAVFQVPGTSSFITSLTALENELYVGTNDSSVHRLDVSNPISPQLKSSMIIPTFGPVEDIALSQGRAYIASEPFGLRVVDVTDPVSMNEIAYYQVPGPGRGVDVAGEYIYFACDDAGLLILKLDVLATPTLVSPSSGTITTTHAITFGWQAGAGAIPLGYNVQVDGSVITTTDTSWPAILPIGVHTWTVRAYNAFGYSAWAAPAWTLEVTDTLPAPRIPILISPLSGTVTTTHAITFAWQASAGATPTGYNVQVDSNVITTTGTTSSTILSVGVHTWTVRAYNAEGYSDWAAPWTVEIHCYYIDLPLMLRNP